MPFAFLLLLSTVPLTGGRLSRLALLRVRGSGWIVAALALQVLMASVVPDAPHVVLIGLHAASYALITWALWLNRALPGLVLIAVGGGTNAAVIALNGGTLPASAEALVAAGYSLDPDAFKNSGVVAEPVLPWLGDIMATPAWLPLRNVISPGDLVILLGGFVLLHVVCRTRIGVLVSWGERPAQADAAATAV